MASRKKKKPNQLEHTVTWMVGCLVLLISNSTLFKSYDASVGEPWFNLVLSGLILIMLGKISLDFRQLQKDVRTTNSQIERVDQLDENGLTLYMRRVYEQTGWSTEPLPSGEAGSCLSMQRGGKRVHAVFQVSRRKLTKDFVKLAWTLCNSFQQHTEAAELWLVTNASFTSQARQEAAERGIRLVDRKALMNLLSESGPAEGLSIPNGRAAE